MANYPEFKPFDYNQAVAKGKQNALADIAIQQGQMGLVDLANKSKQQNTLSTLSEKALSGDNDALKKITMIDSEAGSKLQDFLSKSNEEQRKKVEQVNKLVYRVALKADTAEKWDEGMAFIRDNYKVDTTQHIGKFSEEYRQKAIAMNGLSIKAIEQYGGFEQIPNAPEGTIGQKNQTTGKYDNIKSKDDLGGGSGSGLKASDENAIMSQAFGLFGGMYDPTTGRFSGLEKDQAQKAQAIGERATRLFAGGGLTRTEAASKAARELNIAIPKLGGQQQTSAQPQPQYQEGQTATGPGGEKIIYRNGQWSPVQ